MCTSNIYNAGAGAGAQTKQYSQYVTQKTRERKSTGVTASISLIHLDDLSDGLPAQGAPGSALKNDLGTIIANGKVRAGA